MPRLTDRLVAKIPFPDKGQTVTRDSDLRGFFVRCGRKSKAWTVQVDRTVDGRRKTITRVLGDAATLGASEARTRAMATIASIKDGTLASGTQEPREPEPDAPITLGRAWQNYRAWFERKVANGRASPVTLRGYEYLGEKVLSPWHGEELLTLATKSGRGRVALWHETITADRGRVIANRSMALLQFVYRHAWDFDEHDLPERSLIRKVEMNKEGAKQKGLTGPELPGWNKVRLTLPNKVRQEFHLVTLLTGLRTGSLKTARWSDVDRKARTLFVPSPKGGEDRAFFVPLSGPIIAALDRVKVEGEILNSRAAATWIFPGATVQGHLTETQERIALVKHDFAFGHRLRRAYKTFAGLAGVNELEQMCLLNHAAGSVSRAYVDRPAMAQALLLAQERISKYILQEMST